MVNKVYLIGHLGKNPTLRVAGENKVAEVTLATRDVWKDADGERQERTEWHRIEVWNARGENFAEICRTGDLVHIEGCLRTSQFEKDGQTHYSTVVRVADWQLLRRKSSSSERDDEEPVGEG